MQSGGPNADPSLVILSQQPNVVNGQRTGPREPISNLDKYAYNVGQGAGTTVYIIDNLFSNSASAKSLLRAEFPNIDSYRSIAVKPEAVSSFSSHEIMVASKIVSKSFGSCKMVNIVWLGLPYTQGRVDPRRWPAMVDALQKIRRDIKDNKLQGKAYVTIAAGFEDATWSVTDSMKVSMNEAIVGVTKLDTLVVMAAGNSGRPIWAYPQTLGSINIRGAVDSAGNPWRQQSTADFVKISAVGANTPVIGKISEQATQYTIITSGTSFSAPGVAGLLACQRMTDAKYNAFLMKGKVSDNVLSDLLAFSYPRNQGGPVVAYNNIDAGTQNVKCGTGVARRQAGNDSADARSAESISSTLTTILASSSANSPASKTTTTTQATETVEPLYYFGTPQNQCPSLELDTCRCLCQTYLDCGACAGSFEVVCVGAPAGCCQCQ